MQRAESTKIRKLWLNVYDLDDVNGYVQRHDFDDLSYHISVKQHDVERDHNVGRHDYCCK